MKMKHRRSILITAMAYLFLWSCGTGTNVWAAASGHYTDLLPNPTSAAGIPSGTLYYNGYDWQISTLGATTVPGDALSRTPITVYQTYISSTVSNTALTSTFTALTGQSSVGTTTLPAAWLTAGRSIRVTAKGRYSTSGAPNWTWGFKLSTTTIMTTGAVGALNTQTGQTFSSVAIITISTAGGSGQVVGTYDVLVGSGTIGSSNNLISYSTNTASAVSCDLTTQVIINPFFQWGTAASGNSITFTTVLVELLN